VTTLQSSVNNGANGPARLELFTVSLLALFMEMLVIRYLGTEVLIFSYFKNVSLMAAFLGLGLGFIWTNSKRDYFCWSGPSFLVLCGVLICALGLNITFLTYVDPFKFMLFGVGNPQGGTVYPIWTCIRTVAIMLSLFALTAFAFVGLGQKMGQLFEKLKPLEAYSVNVLGSLAGTILFSVLSYFEQSPGAWMVTGGLLFVAVKRRPMHFALLGLGIVYLVWLGAFVAKSQYGDDYVETLWSPYYRVDVIQSHPPGGLEKGLKYGYDLHVSYGTFQSIVDCRPENLAKFPQKVQDEMLISFSLPYGLFNSTPKRVLILGSGNGSDVVGAIRSGVEKVDAVEIDPVLSKLGKTLHPERPYLSPQAHLNVMDARTYLKNCHEKYDLIVFAYLDSHTAFSCLSSLRTDNYIFTSDAYKEAAKLLGDDGVIYVSFICFQDWLWDRHAKALAAATGMTPLGYCANNGNVDVGVLIAGPGVRGKTASELHMNKPPRKVDLNSPVPIATDDWPFLFLPQMELSTTYVLPLLLILLLSACVVFKQLKAGAKEPLNWEMFLLGMGFMLLEVRAMADLSLLFGSTWIVNSVVISVVLFVILVGNWLAARLNNIRFVPVFLVALIVSLGLSTAIHVADLTAYGEVAGRVLGILFYVFPVAFAATVFALFFRGAQVSSQALAFNLFGGLVGVALEYLSMLFGIRALGWIGVTIYSVVLLFYLKQGGGFKSQPVAVSQELSQGDKP
jgi:hypothetical protein